MKPLFIVNDAQGTKVVSANVLTKDIRDVFAQHNITNYKRCDVESLAEDVVIEKAGKAISSEEYAQMINQYVYVLQEYNNITPYRYLVDVVIPRHDENPSA